MPVYILIVLLTIHGEHKQFNAAVYETEAHCKLAASIALKRDDVTKAVCDPTDLQHETESFE